MKRYIITNKETDVIIALGKELSVQNNGNWILTFADTAYPNSFCYAYAAGGRLEETSNPEAIKNIKPIEIPDEVKPGKYCYTVNDGFFINPDYGFIN